MTGATVAVDVGTTLIKAVVLDDGGSEVAVASKAATVLRPDAARSEQDMAEVLAAVHDVIGRAVSDSAVSDSAVSVRRVALTAQGDGAWLVDGAGGPAGPAVLWNDARAAAVVRRWDRDGVLERAFRINGSLGNPGLPHAILAWTLAQDPARLEDADAVLTCGSWLHLALTGTTGLHPSEASAPWLDATTGAYSDELLDLYGLGSLRHLLPPVLDDEGLTAPLTAEAAAATGLPSGTPVTLAPYDVVATAAGSGCTSAGDAFCILGTTLCTGVLRAEPDLGGVPGGLTLLGTAGSPVVRAFPTLAGTGVVDWAAGLLGVDSAAELVRLAAESAPGAGGVRVLPYLSPAGERAPFLDVDARGSVTGLTFGATRADVARAVIEGLAHVIRDCLDSADTVPDSLTLSGGGSASDLWCSTVADVTGLPVARTGGQVGARGAAFSALVAAGEVRDLADAARLLGSPRVFEPSADARALQEERHEDFLATRAALGPRWREWAAS